MATLADALLLASLHAACFTAAWDAAAFVSLLDRGNAFALLADFANESQSFILVQVASPESEILTLGTGPAARRAGLARAVLAAAAAEAQRRGAREMFLEVADDNQAALKLYRGVGFSVAGHRRGYYVRDQGTAADAVILRASLPLSG